MIPLAELETTIRLERKRAKIIARNTQLREQIVNRNKQCDQWKTEINDNIKRLNDLNEELQGRKK